MNSVSWSVSKLVKLLSCGDVVEMGDTLVLETSAFARESSNLSIPTKRLTETWPMGLRHRTANAECPRKGTIRSNRIVSARFFQILYER